MTSMAEDRAFWMAFAHLPKWRYERINKLIVQVLDERKLSFAEFFELGHSEWGEFFGLSSQERTDLDAARSSLPELQAMAGELMEQGFDMIPIRSREYSRVLRRNLTLRYCPPLLYTKGSKRLLLESTVAIVGSRTASEAALQFTETVARRCSADRRVVVSGFARGVDQLALDSALKYQGRSIIVLPQGIKTFTVGFKEYQAQIIDGDVLVLSAYFPKLSWSAGLALARNTLIYGLSEEIYVAESGFQGGTWSGALDGLRKGRRVYVRKPAPGEENANELLISKGALPVDDEGNLTAPTESHAASGLEAPFKQLHFNDIQDTFEARVREWLSRQDQPQSAREIKEKLKLTMKPTRLSRLLREMEFVEVLKGENGVLGFRTRKNQPVG